MTYTEGEVAEALIQLGRATQEAVFYRQAERFLSFALSPASRLTESGILREHCETDGSCRRLRHRLDIPAFKGLFVAAVSDWSSATGSHEFDPFLASQATSLLANARGPCVGSHRASQSGCLFGFEWIREARPPAVWVTLGSQEAALDALTAVLPADSRH
jgi:hypothetical protein